VTTKPFNIPKELVWRAYKLVRANAGAAGVDNQSIDEFNQDLKGNLYKALRSEPTTLAGKEIISRVTSNML
jgi:hypothetical protein